MNLPLSGLAVTHTMACVRQPSHCGSCHASIIARALFLNLASAVTSVPNQSGAVKLPAA